MTYDVTVEDFPERKPGEVSWETLDDEEHLAHLDAAVASIEQAKARGEFTCPTPATEPPQPPVPPALPAPSVGHIETSWATPDEQRQLAEIDALIEAAKAEGKKRGG